MDRRRQVNEQGTVSGKCQRGKRRIGCSEPLSRNINLSSLTFVPVETSADVDPFTSYDHNPLACKRVVRHSAIMLQPQQN